MCVCPSFLLGFCNTMNLVPRMHPILALPHSGMYQGRASSSLWRAQHAWVLITPRALSIPRVAQRTSYFLLVMVTEETKNKSRTVFD